MAVPAFLNTGFKFQELFMVADVQTILDAWVAMVTTADNPAIGWKKWYTHADFPGLIESGEYCSPSAANPVMIKPTRVSATQLSWRVRGTNLVTICTRSIVIPSTNTVTARVFAGDCHSAIDVLTWSAAAEFLLAGSLDPLPDTASSEINLVYGMGSRSGTTRDSSDYWDACWMQDGDDASPVYTTRACQFKGQSGTVRAKRTPSGSIVYRPRELFAKTRGATGTYGNYHWAGRCFQILLAPSILPSGSRVRVPIDTGVLGEFILMAGPNNASNYYIALRCA